MGNLLGYCLEKTNTNIPDNFKHPTLSIIDKVHMHFIHPYNKLELYINKLCQENIIVITNNNNQQKYIEGPINIKILYQIIDQDDINTLILQYESNNIQACLHVIALWYILVELNIICYNGLKDIHVRYPKINECHVIYLKKYTLKISLEHNYNEY